MIYNTYIYNNLIFAIAVIEEINYRALAIFMLTTICTIIILNMLRYKMG
eukprot:UN08471